jgi:beta-lactam-binding protein with PASTA domain
MKESSLRPSLSPSHRSAWITQIVCFVSCFWLASNPGLADTSSPSSTRGVYVPATLAQVPDLRQRPLPAAQQSAKDARLRLEVSGAPPAEPSRAVVVEQKPEPNTLVPVGSAITVVVRVPPSRQVGPPREVPVPAEVMVPELRRRALSEAQQRVAERRLKLEVSGGSPKDSSQAVVVEQKPPPETRVPVNSVVVVTVRIGPPPPQIVSPPAVQPPRTVSPPVIPPPPVVSPPPRVAPPGMVVPPEVPPPDETVLVPDLRQRPLMDALQRIRNARLRLEVSGGWPSDPAHAVVAEQAPAPNTRVRIGTSVTVQTLPSGQALQPSPPPTQPPLRTQPPRQELVVVPELRRQSLPEARGLTRSAQLELQVMGQAPADETRMVVVDQRPATGTRVAIKTIVLVELGPALRAVPELRKRPFVEARQVLNQAGFELSIMGDTPSNESRAQVMEQAPMPGVLAPAGSAVTVRVTMSRLTTWVMVGAGVLLAAGAALGVSRWRGTRSPHATIVPSVRVIAAGDVGRQEIRSNGTAAVGPAIRLRSRSDPGSQTVEPEARIVAEERTIGG